MKTNNISFGSTYKAHITLSNIEKDRHVGSCLMRYLDFHDYQYKEKFPSAKELVKSSNSNLCEYSINVPDSDDIYIERYCALKGINLKKINPKEVLSLKGITERIELPPRGHGIAWVDTEKLENFIRNQDNNFKHTKNTYEEYQKNRTDFVLKSGDKFEPPCISIQYICDDEKPESLKKYVKIFGADDLNPEMVSVWMCNNGKDSGVNSYYGLKDKNFKEIPVYMDSESYENAKTLGLLAK